jgi:hypothetical protein
MKEIIENVGLIVAAITAIYGINAWRREFRGKKEYELAEEVLMLSYDCRDRLRTIRSHFVSNGEGSSRKIDPNETPEETELLNRAYIVFERYEKYQETFSKLFALRYRFMALFGKEAVQPIEDFRIALNEIFISAQMLPTYWRRQGRVQMTKEQFKEHLGEMREHESIFWGTFSERDKFNTKIEGIVSQIDVICSQILRPIPLWQRILHFFKVKRGSSG